jgi:hypothetical protein
MCASVVVQARLQRPGWNDGPKAARNIDFTFRQEYTLFSEMGTSGHYLERHNDAMANHTHHHKVSHEVPRDDFVGDVALIS